MNRYPSLDIIRAVLALSVVIIHAFGFQNFIVQSQWSVDIFIVLSGFVITMLVTRKREPYSIFIARRFLRLYPVFLVCLLASLLIRPLVIGTSLHAATRELAENDHYWPLVLTHLLLLHGVVPEAILPHSSGAFLVPAWSIGVEWLLYLIAPLAVIIMRSRWKWALLAASLCVLIPQVHWRLYYYGSEYGGWLYTKLYLFLIGNLLYQYLPERLACVGVPRLLEPLRLIGVISYSLYLVHYPVMAFTNACLADLHLAPIVQAFVLLAIGLPVSLVVSVPLYLGIEKPFIALGKRLNKKQYDPVHSSLYPARVI